MKRINAKELEVENGKWKWEIGWFHLIIPVNEYLEWGYTIIRNGLPVSATNDRGCVI